MLTSCLTFSVHTGKGVTPEDAQKSVDSIRVCQRKEDFLQFGVHIFENKVLDVMSNVIFQSDLESNGDIRSTLSPDLVAGDQRTHQRFDYVYTKPEGEFTVVYCQEKGQGE